MNQLAADITDIFRTKFQRRPLLVQSPGRVNLIGEHTDYNEGFVLPAAVDKHIMFGFAPNDGTTARLYSVDMEQEFSWDLTATDYPKSALGWPDYIMGCVDQLRQAGYEVSGFDCVFGGTIPIGAGMSSSAALEGGTLFGLTQLFTLPMDKLTMVKLGQKAENEFVGVQCGIMDQFANIYSRADTVFKLDCRSLEYEYYPFTRDDLKIVLCDTQVRRELAGSEYNVRRSQCEEGVALLQQYDPEIASLRDVNREMLQERKNEFDPVVYSRCEYVIEENNRVNQACQDLENDDFAAFGTRMYQSHEGLKDKYEVSSKELDLLVEITEQMEGVLGARMMGAGFGGCTINLVQTDAIEAFTTTISERYNEQMEQDALFYETTITEGVHKLLPEE
ncbi:MAG TPA: galactokinase [bacterium]|nr:galactokinase [bacterium]